MVKNIPANAGDTRYRGSIPGSGRFPEGGHGNRLQYSQEFHAKRSLVGYSPWGPKESDTTELLTYTHTYIQEYCEKDL